MKLKLIILFTLIAVLPACQSANSARTLKLDIAKSFTFKPRELPTGGNPSDHPCIRGNYHHVYKSGSEVWLCCIPPAEILSDSFQCDGTIFSNPQLASLFGGTDYAKIRYCSLLHPTATEPAYIPVCIPAPLQVDVDEYTEPRQ